MRSTVLLSPGPVTLSERVRRALVEPDIGHREPEFARLQARVRTQLLEVYGCDPGAWTAVLLTGSGTAVVEAMITSLVPRSGRLLVVENGVYGERMSRIAEIHGIPAAALHFAWDEEIDLERLETALAAEPAPTHVAVVHHETTTGRLNDLSAVARICRRRGVPLLLDAVSSFGAERIDFEAWGVAACAATANKCLHGVPGVSFAIVRRDALVAGSSPPRSLYLDLGEAERAQDRDTTLFTPAIPALRALREALEELSERGGWEKRAARYAELAERVRVGLAERGVEPWLSPAVSSAVLRSYRLPQGMSYDELHDALRQRGFVIYAGQAVLRHELFRVSTMGAIRDEDVDRLLAAFRELC